MPKKIVVVPVGTTTADVFGLLFVSYRPYGRYLFIESTRDSLIILAYRIPRGTNFVCASRDNCCKYYRTELSSLCSVGMTAVWASLSFGNYFTKTFFKCKRGNCWCNSLFICVTIGSLFFSDPRGMTYIHPSRDQSLKGSPIVKSYFTSTFLPFTT